MVIIIMAWRNIWRNKVRSLIIMGSVALGLVAGLFVLSIYKGMLTDRVNTVIREEVAHLQVHDPAFKEDYDAKYVITDIDKVQDKLNQMESVEAFTTRTISQGMVATGTGSSGIQVVGVNPEKEDTVSKLSSKITDGDGFRTKKKHQIIIGKKLADKMHLKINSKAILTFTDRESNIISAAFRVAGIYQTDNAPRDERIAFVRLDELNALLSMGDDYHELAIILRRDEDIDSVRSALKSAFPQAKVESWQELSPETKLMIDTTDQYSYIFITIIMFALSFGIINSMLMAVLERSREIGMLLALGMNRLKVFTMILTETIFLTLSGTPAGILISWLIVIFYERYGLDIGSVSGEAMSSFGFSTTIYPQFPWEKMVTEMMIVIVAAFVSSLIPAVKAIRLQPVEALQK
ncbi:MAG TPA: FtsX-like permease family protein [Chryseosolibacter sp.]|nr:FtsX-like permease family protein [Chryseosolibacter sp.]